MKKKIIVAIIKKNHKYHFAYMNGEKKIWSKKLKLILLFINDYWIENI